MTGLYQHTLDTKGRLFVPAKMREEMGDIFYVTVAVRCLNVYSLEHWNELEERASQMTRQQRTRLRPIFSHAARCELDGQGRILLPQMLRDYAHLNKNVTVVGNIDCAELWDTDTWNKIDANESSPENIRSIYEEMDF